MTSPLRSKGSRRPWVGVKPPPSCRRHAFGVTGAVRGCPWFPRVWCSELIARPGGGRALRGGALTHALSPRGQMEGSML